MPQSLTNFDNALKDNYGPGLRNAINNSTPLWSEISVNDEDIVGRQAVWSLHTGRSTSTGSRGELGKLPVADRQRFNKLTEDLEAIYHTIKVSGQADALTKGDVAAFARAVEEEIEGAEKDMKFDVARQAFNDVVTIGATRYLGSLGKVESVAGAVVTLGANVTASEMRYFFVNEEVAVVNGGDATIRGTTTISSINKTTKAITLAAAPAGTAANDYIARGGATDNHSFGEEMNGLRYLIHDTAVFAGIDPATVPEWASLTHGSSTTPISELFFEEMQEAVETDGSGDTPDLFVAEHKNVRKLANTLQAQKSYEGREMTLTSGWKGLQVAQGVLVKDRFCPSTKVFGVYKPELERFVGLDFQWDTLGNTGVFYKALDGSDAVEARFKGYMNFVATKRNCHVVGTTSAP